MIALFSCVSIKRHGDIGQVMSTSKKKNPKKVKHRSKIKGLCNNKNYK